MDRCWIGRTALGWPEVWPGPARLASLIRKLSLAAKVKMTASERPSCGSSGLPWGLGPENGVEDTKEAPHASDDGDLLGAAAADKLLVVGFEDRVPADGAEGCHEEDIADARPAAGDGPVATHLTGVSVDGCDAYEGSGLAAIEAAEFGHFGNEGAGGDAADAGDALKEVVGSAPGWRTTDGVVDVVVKFGELCLEHLECGVDGLGDLGGAGLADAILLHADHFDDLATAGNEFGQGLRGGVWEWPWLGADALAEKRDRRSVEAIRLGQAAGGASEVADLAWVDHDQRQAGAGDRGSDSEFEAAGGLDNDKGWWFGPQPRQELVETWTITRDGEGVARWAEMHIEAVLGNVDADKAVRRSRKLVHDPSLQMRARSRSAAAQATVRVPGWDDGRRPQLRDGLIHPRRSRAAVRRQPRRLTTGRQL